MIYSPLLMEDFKDISLDELLDMLARHTLEYTRMFHEGATGQMLAHYEYLISYLQSEIIRRRSFKLTMKAT